MVTDLPTATGPADALLGNVVRFTRLLHRLKSGQGVHRGTSVDRAAFTLLLTLDRRGPQRVASLADLVHADPSTVSRQTGQLVRAGLVVRQADPDDGRACLLATTAEGRSLARRVAEQRGQLFAGALAGWTPAEVATFTELLGRFNDGLESLDLSVEPESGPADTTATATPHRQEIPA